MNMKRVLTIVGVALAAFFVITQPVAAGGFVADILSWLGEAANAFITFLKSLAA